MILSVIAYGVLIGLVLTSAACLIHAQERAASRPVRWIWASVIALTIALTLLAPLRQQAVAPTATMERMPYVANTADKLEQLRMALAHVVDAASTPMRLMFSSLADISSRAQQVALMLWCASAALALALIVVVYLHVGRRRHQWNAATMLGSTVRISTNAGPAVVGINPMEIVMPSWVFAKPLHEQQLVLAHEMEHVRARDPLLLLAALVAVALMPWNPLLWFALSRLRLAVEIDCDRRVLQRGIAPARYGSLLLDLSEHRSSLATALPALAYHTSHLERRLIAMTSPPVRYLRARRLGGAIIAAAAIFAACESQLPSAPRTTQKTELAEVPLRAGAVQGEKLVLDAADSTTFAITVRRDSTNEWSVIDKVERSGGTRELLRANKLRITSGEPIPDSIDAHARAAGKVEFWKTVEVPQLRKTAGVEMQNPPGVQLRKTVGVPVLPPPPPPPR